MQPEWLKADSSTARGIWVVLLMCLMALLLTHCRSVTTHALNFPALFGSFERHASISYAPGERGLLDVYAPRDAKHRPVVVFWHGGLWVEGSREDYRFVGAALARAGYVAVLPDYRLYPAVSFPGFVEDGASAVRWAHEHIAEFGGDPETIFVMGHSAGAHIASLVALDHRYLSAHNGSPEWIRGFIGLSGPYAIDNGPSPTSVGICAARAACKDLLAAVFAAPYTSRDWQPLYEGAGKPPPTLLLHGSKDAFVSVRHSEILRDRILAQAGDIELHLYPDADHTDTILAFSSWPMRGPPVMTQVQRFIEAHTKRQ